VDTHGIGKPFNVGTGVVCMTNNAKQLHIIVAANFEHLPTYKEIDE